MFLSCLLTMKVLSLFDGISCARVALDRAGIPVESYSACEIDKNAIKVSQKNYPDLVRLGDVREVCGGCESYDLLIGGSPCQDLSIAKKDRQGLDGNRSSLFWEYVRIWKTAKPRWFVLENVASMPKKDRDIITAEMGVEPVMFNASLVSAQCRKRLFWTNIPFVLPPDRGILLKDILEPDAEVDERMTVMGGKSACLDANYHKGSSVEHSISKKVRTQVKFTPTAQTGRNETKKLGYVGENDHQAKRVYDEEGKCPALNVVCNSMVKLGHIGNTDSQGNRVYSDEGKSVTLSANGGGGGAKTGLYKVSTLPIYIPEGNSTNSTAPIRTGAEIRRKLVNGVRADYNPDAEVLRRIELRNDDKCGTLTTVLKDNHVVEVASTRIRKLTPIECERLQGLPDRYTEGVAMTHRYKCLGNAFNVDVVAHILSAIPIQAD
jgi:DNA-cytosine methyltransferase